MQRSAVSCQLCTQQRLRFNFLSVNSTMRPSNYFIAISWLSSLISIAAIGWLGRALHFGHIENFFLITSFGATAVLVHAAPNSPLAQPRNVIGGHIVSAVVGVLTAQFLPLEPVWLAAIAVSTAIAAMHLTHTLHPPGGATALLAVSGGAAIERLGYWFILSPVAAGAALMVLIAWLANRASRDPARHYPHNWW